MTGYTVPNEFKNAQILGHDMIIWHVLTCFSTKNDTTRLVWSIEYSKNCHGPTAKPLKCVVRAVFRRILNLVSTVSLHKRNEDFEWVRKYVVKHDTYATFGISCSLQFLSYSINCRPQRTCHRADTLSWTTFSGLDSTLHRIWWKLLLPPDYFNLVRDSEPFASGLRPL